MKKSKGKATTILIVIITLILAGVAIFTAIRLYQLRQTSISPVAPSSKPKAQEVVTTTTSCSLSFTVVSASASPNPSTSPSASASPSASTTPAASGTPSASGTPNPQGTPNSCGGTCGSNFNCTSNLVCYQGSCRNPDCVSNISCSCGGASATPGPSLPASGTNWPSVLGTGLGIMVIIGSLLLAL